MRSRSHLVSILLCLLLCAVERACGHGAYHDELAALNAQIEGRAPDVALFLKRAQLHLSHEEWQPALHDLERVDRLAPDNGLTDGPRGAALNLGGHYSAALLSLDAHLIRKPGDAEALFQKARAHARLGEREQAVAAYRAALPVHLEPTAARYCEAAEVIAVHEGTEAALDFLDSSGPVASDPETVQCAFDLALKAKLFDRAIAYATHLQAQAPRPEPWMMRIARLLTEAGRAEEAAAAWHQLHNRLNALPALERGTPLLAPIVRETSLALGLPVTAPVVAAPQP